VPTCAEVLARTLRESGVTRMFGLPGGEMLDFLEAARRAGIRFILTRHEATASFMADVTGQIQRRPGVCVATLGPGAVNMTLGVANAYLDRSPVVAITASLARSSAPFAATTPNWVAVVCLKDRATKPKYAPRAMWLSPTSPTIMPTPSTRSETLNAK